MEATYRGRLIWGDLMEATLRGDLLGRLYGAKMGRLNEGDFMGRLIGKT